MTTTLEIKQRNNEGLAIDLDSPDKPSEPSIPSIPNGCSSSANGDAVGGSELSVKQPSSPLKQVTNTNAYPLLPISRPSNSSAHNPSSAMNGFKLPPPPRRTTTTEREQISRPRTTLYDTNANPKPRQLSSLAQSPRRNSFPSSKKDGFEGIRALRDEAKLARERGTIPIIINNSGSPTKRHKNSISGTTVNGSSSTTTIDSNGYFTTKPSTPLISDYRNRSSTTPGLPPSIPILLRRRGSHINPPNMPPRLEHIRRESNRSSNADNLPTTLWDYLILEMQNSEIKGVEEYKKERLSNFLRIPERFEKVYRFWGRGLIVVNLVWMGGLSGFVFTYVYSFTSSCPSCNPQTHSKSISPEYF